MTLADKGGRRGLANADIPDKIALKWFNKIGFYLPNLNILIILAKYCMSFNKQISFGERGIENVLTRRTRRKGVGKMLTLSDKGGRGGLGYADIG